MQWNVYLPNITGRTSNKYFLEAGLAGILLANTGRLEKLVLQVGGRRIFIAVETLMRIASGFIHSYKNSYFDISLEFVVVYARQKCKNCMWQVLCSDTESY